MLLFCSFISNHAVAQDARAFLIEPVARVYIPTNGAWAYSLGVAHRGLLLEALEPETKEEDYEHEHLELNGFTEFWLNENSHFALRLRYRLREIFDDENYDEMRIIQQYYYSHENTVLKYWHRARFEQRFQNIRTTFRWRYRFGILPPISSVWAISASTEALYSVSQKAKPSVGHRVYLGVLNNSIKDVDLKVGVELRMMDYVQNLQSEYFLFTSVLIYL